MQDLRALVGLEAVVEKPERGVLIVNGERARDALERLLPAMSVVTWIGGVSRTDWAPLAGKRVGIWADGGAAGRRYAALIAERLFKMGCKIKLVRDESEEALTGALRAVAEGWSLTQVKDYLKAHLSEELAEPPEKPPGPSHVVGGSESPPKPRKPKAEARPPPSESILSLWQRYGIKYCSTKAHSNASNCYLALKGINDDRNLGISYDEFLKQIVWHEDRRVMDDNDIIVLQCELQDGLELVHVRHTDVKHAVTRFARERVVNCAKDWLLGLSWDGTERLPHLMSDAFGTQFDEYTSAVGRCFIMGMAKRILQPGCQQDYVLVLEGRQGERKSSALAIIGGPWYAEIHDEFGSLEFLIAIQGKVLVAIGELAGFKGARLERIKGIITRRVDTFRSKYGIWANDHARIACFAADTNEGQYLNDPTGGRRYWPIATGTIDTDWLTNHRDQLWAEAVVRLQRGESYWDVPQDQASDEQEKRREIIPWEERLIPFLAEKRQIEITMSNCLTHLGVAPRDEMAAARIIAPILRRQGWRRMRKWVGKDRMYVYRTEDWTDLSNGADRAETL
jgi:predicted P-loop ATPase